MYKVAIVDRYIRPEVSEIISSYAEMLVAYGHLQEAYDLLVISGTYGAITERLYRKKGI